MEHSQSLPYASSLCGACYEVCPVKINIPEILIELRRQVVENGGAPLTERLAMKAAAFAFGGEQRFEFAQAFTRVAQKPFEHNGTISSLPGMLAAWTSVRDLQPVPKQSFRQWWAEREERKTS